MLEAIVLPRLGVRLVLQPIKDTASRSQRCPNKNLLERSCYRFTLTRCVTSLVGREESLPSQSKRPVGHPSYTRLQSARAIGLPETEVMLTPAAPGAGI